MKKVTIILIFSSMLPQFTVSSNNPYYELSTGAEITVLTCEPGNELYSLFGHSAIRVKDSIAGIDWVYNYGIFDFSTPNFYWKFTRGKLPYQLGKYDFKYFLPEYQVEERSVYEQVLLLTSEEKQALFEFLEWNYLPENRFYLYDFLYNNCSTKIIDVILEIINNRKVTRGYESTRVDMSFRQNLEPYLVNNKPWALFGINLALGMPTDKEMTARENMFLPLNLMKQLTLSEGRKLVKPIDVLYQGNNIDKTYPNILRPYWLSWLFFTIVLLITIYEWIRSKNFVLFDKVYFGLLGALGFFILFLWFGTDHLSTKNNLNILWAFPLHLLVMLFYRSIPVNMLKYYFLITGIFSLLLLFTKNLLPQELPPEMVPLVLVVVIRTIRHQIVVRENLGL
ncbi:MAG: DUF4105 domain-containing protein [Cyclobacteriaceae bacterium]